MFRKLVSGGYSSECKSANYILYSKEELTKFRIHHSECITDQEAARCLNSKSEKYGITFLGNHISIYDIVNFITLDFSNKLLGKYPLTKVKITEFDAVCSKYVSLDDELTARIVFVYLISELPWAHDMIDHNFNSYQKRLFDNIGKYHSFLNVQDDIAFEIYRVFGLSATVFLLYHHLKECYKQYRNAIQGHYKTYIHENIEFKIPEYAIEKEKNGAVNIYEFL